MSARPPRWLPVLVVLASSAAAAVPLGCDGGRPTAGPTAPADDPRQDDPGFFEDVTAPSGLVFTYRNGEEADQYTILETLGGGVALLDYDGDGLLDVFVVGGGYFDGPDKTQIKGYPNRLYKNLGGWKFRDVTQEVGLDQPVFYGHGCAVADYDGDGRPDLLVTGYGRTVLYRNVGGKRFDDVTVAAGLAAGGPGVHWSTGAAWADLDGDGRPDLFVAHYVDWSFKNHLKCKGPGTSRHDVCAPHEFDPLPQRLYLNNGDGTFRDATADAGVKPGKGLGVLVADLDGDGRPDVYVANDGLPNHLYLNRGGGRFEEAGMARGAAVAESGAASGSMGVDAADYDGSGHLSVFVANFEKMPHDLYQNRGGGHFHHVSRRTGVTALGLDFVGFGTGFFDYDNDGVEDLFVSNGHVLRHPVPPVTVAQRAVLLRNLRSRGQAPNDVRFREASDQAGPYFRGRHRGRGVAFGDLDNDGRVDLVVSHCNEPVTLLRNVHPGGHHWLGVRLTGRPNRDAVGAALTLEVDGRKLVRQIKGGGSYLSASDPRVVFGLGQSKAVEKLTVRWPSGRTQTWDGPRLGADRYVVLTEGEDAVEPAAPKVP